MATEPRKLVTIREACRQLGVHRETILRWAKFGKLKAVLLPGNGPGGRRPIRIRQDDIDRMVNQGEAEAQRHLS